MTYSELLGKALLGTAVCHNYNLSCCDCPYIHYRKNIDSQSYQMLCQRVLSHDTNVLINIMKYLDKIQEEVTDNG